MCPGTLLPLSLRLPRSPHRVLVPALLSPSPASPVGHIPVPAERRGLFGLLGTVARGSPHQPLLRPQRLLPHHGQPTAGEALNRLQNG